MQSLIITLLIPLLIALVKIRSLQAQTKDCHYWRDFWKQQMEAWRVSCGNWRTKYDIQVGMINKLQLDNALLRASLKRKHLRVPKL